MVRYKITKPLINLPLWSKFRAQTERWFIHLFISNPLINNHSTDFFKTLTEVSVMLQLLPSRKKRRKERRVKKRERERRDAICSVWLCSISELLSVCHTDDAVRIHKHLINLLHKENNTRPSAGKRLAEEEIRRPLVFIKRNVLT